ncbi:class Ib ribonucleoside-diphosphate reductase assembly flavoprotein NrdI [Corynebacterium uterequi]|nr:class Ib ribonucleoside-diphosphate reductase assembly flavoprotein NrdI [Corynebacterium uterequi]
MSKRVIRFHPLPAGEEVDLVYFSSVSNNTHRFVQGLRYPGAGTPVRIPLRPHLEGMPRVHRPYVLVVPTYGGGNPAHAIPQQVKDFLNDPTNRSFLRGVIASGNTNFGEDYCLAGRQITEKTRVPLLYCFELLGTPHDTSVVSEGLAKFWTTVA